MPYIKEMKTRSYWNGKPSGKKSHSTFFVTIPKALVEALGWKKGFEVEFKIKNGKVILRSKEQ
jgi:formylmethanofuran dehydrogenase subunit D